jgi:hypothetical protein
VAFPHPQRFFDLLLFFDVEENPAEMARDPCLVLDHAGARPKPSAAPVHAGQLE